MAAQADTVGRFFLRALLWLGPALAVWYLLRKEMTAPAAWLATQAMQLAFPRWVTGAEVSDTTLALLTRLTVIDQSGRIGEMAPEVNLLVYGYGLPLLAALLFASRARKPGWKLAAGALALVPFQAWGVCFGWLAQIAVTSAEATQVQTGFGPWARNGIAAGYQLGFLILPTLAPVAGWLVLDRRMLQRFMAEDALSGSLQSAAAAARAPQPPDREKSS